MRHRKSFNHLSRPSSHRKALLRNLSCSLIESKRLVTTVAKAKELRRYIEPLITISRPDFISKYKSDNSITEAKPNSLYRKAFKYLGNGIAVEELFSRIGVTVGNRRGGYTRIIRMQDRLGDGASMCMIELVDYNKMYSQKWEPTLATDKSKEVDAPKSKRSRRSKKKTLFGNK